MKKQKVLKLSQNKLLKLANPVKKDLATLKKICNIAQLKPKSSFQKNKNKLTITKDYSLTISFQMIQLIGILKYNSNIKTQIIKLNYKWMHQLLIKK